MALTELRYHSASLGKSAAAMAILPEGSGGPYPVWYLLHGLSDDHSIWARRSNIERYVEGLPLIVVMPDGHRGFYTDARHLPRGKYESAIVRDLVPWVDATFRTVPRRWSRVVSGLSMGGYGALKLALKHPGLFCAAASHSGALDRGSVAVRGRDEWNEEMRGIFGDDPRGGPDDLFALTSRAAREELPALWIDCGTADGLLPANRRMHRHLARLKVPHVYREHPGGHTWDYWDLHVRDTIGWFRALLGI